MKLYVMVDMEGISGLYSWEQCLPKEPLYAEGRAAMTQDVNACIAGLIEGGAGEIIVRDQHAAGNSLILEQADQRASYVRGRSCQARMPGLSGCNGLILLGYHAMAGADKSCLAHTFNTNIQNLWLNGQRAGEIAVDAAMAGDMNVPAIMVSGDQAACAEAQSIMPDILIAPVKRGLGPAAAILMPPEKARQLIRERAREAVGRLGKMKPFKVTSPVTIRQEFTNGYAPVNTARKPYMKLIDSRTYEVTGDSVEETYWRL